MIDYKKIFLYTASLVAMAALLWMADFQEILTHLIAMDIKILIQVILLQMLTIFLIIWQWRLTSQVIGNTVSWNKMIYINMIGTFVESITPALKTGSELTRVYYLRSHAGLSLTSSVSMLILQKAISLSAFIFLNIAGLVFFLTSYSEKISNTIFFIVYLIVLAVIFLLLVFFIKSPKSLSFLINPISFIPERFKIKAESFLVRLQLTVATLFKNTRLFLMIVVQALVIWILYAVKAYIIVRSLGIGIDFAEITVATLFSYMIAMIPLFPGGLGSFEAAYSFMFVSMGFDIEIGIASALTLRLVTFWFVFLISVIYLAVHALKSNLQKIRALFYDLNVQKDMERRHEL